MNFMPSYIHNYKESNQKIDKNDQLDQKQLAIPQYNQVICLVGS